MKTALKLVVLVLLLAGMATIALPAQAGGDWCTATPTSGPVGTVFTISCWGFDPNTWLNIYAVEPDGRASGINVYGFFPTSVKSDVGGNAAFSFVTKIEAFASVPVGDYTFVVQELAPGNGIAIEQHVSLTVTNASITLQGAWLWVSEPAIAGSGNVYFNFQGEGFLPFEVVSIWVTQPPGQNCSGLGIDQLSLETLGAGSSSLWAIDPGQNVKATGTGRILFSMVFRQSACRGFHHVTARALGSGRGASVEFEVPGRTVTETGAWLVVNPSSIPAYRSLLTVTGYGFPPLQVINCWFTRPDGRVLAFINFNAKTDAAGVMGATVSLDDAPPFTSTEPGVWHVTCATPTKSALAIAEFLVYGLVSDP